MIILGHNVIMMITFSCILLWFCDATDPEASLLLLSLYLSVYGQFTQNTAPSVGTDSAKKHT